MFPNPQAPPICPKCGEDMDETGPVQLVESDGEFEAEAVRFDCIEGHTIFVVERLKE